MKDVTFVISSLGGGGAEGVCVNIANSLAMKGWNVTILVLHLSDAEHAKYLNDDVVLHDLNIMRVRNCFRNLKKYLHLHNPKVVIAFNYELAVMLYLVRKLSFIDFRLIARNVNTFSKNINASGGFWHGVIVKTSIRYLYCNVDFVVNQCLDMQQDLLNALPKLEGKSKVIYNPVAQKYVDYFDSDSVETKQNYIIIVGRLEAQKSLHYAIRAFKLVKQNNPDIKLKIVGQGSLKSDLLHLISELKLDNDVVFEGYSDDVQKLYSQARLTLLTSEYEGFPNVLLESITVGTPVVSFNCPSGPREIIIPGINGFLVEHLSGDDLVLKINTALDVNWDKNSVNATAHRFSNESVIGEWEMLINDFYNNDI